MSLMIAEWQITRINITEQCKHNPEEVSKRCKGNSRVILGCHQATNVRRQVLISTLQCIHSGSSLQSMGLKETN